MADDIYGDEESEAWVDPNQDWDFETGFVWTDNEGNEHELQVGEIPGDYELRSLPFETPEEAEAYIRDILTGASQYFEIYEEEEGYGVYYVGGSE